MKPRFARFAALRSRAGRSSNLCRFLRLLAAGSANARQRRAEVNKPRSSISLRFGLAPVSR
jgi:hypothetical protein